jgi:glycosyltransferase involved in cell wall biosynthesis
VSVPADRVLRVALGQAVAPRDAALRADTPEALAAAIAARRPGAVHVLALHPEAAGLLDVAAAHGARVVVSAPLVLTPGVRAAVLRCAHAVLPPSDAVRRTLLAQGLPAALVAAPGEEARDRALAGEPAGPGPAEHRPVAVDWLGDHVSHASLALVNRRVGDRLPRGEVDLRRVGRVDTPAPPRAVPADVEVRHAWPPDLTPPAAGRLALIQPWEFGAIPQAWVEPLGRDVDEVWVPSAHVARMYLGAGLDADRVHVLPNGVDLERLRPDGPRLALDAPEGLRLLFVGGWIWRKGGDVLLAAVSRAFAGRDDVTLVVKDFGAQGVYRGASRADLRAAVDAGDPRVLHLTQELDDDGMAALFRACDVLVAPYRGEGFGMPVLEAMACGLPVVATAGGPTDEFCPPGAGWRIRSRRAPMPGGTVDGMPTAGEPWVLEPDVDHLVELLRDADARPQERRARGRAARAAAQALSWDAVAGRYAERLRALAAREPRLARPRGADAPVAWPAPATLRVLAVPAWRGEDRLAELLGAWAAAVPAGTGACLELLADPATDGEPAALEAHVLAAVARAGVDLESCADIDVFMCPATPDRDVRVHAEVDAYVALHDGAPGHARLARRVLEPTAAALRGLHPSPHLPAEEAA